MFSVHISAYNALVGVDSNLGVVQRSLRSFLPSESVTLFQTLQVLRRLAITHLIFAQIILSLCLFVHLALRCIRVYLIVSVYWCAF